MSRPKVCLVRGHQATHWELHPWELLSDRFEVTLLETASNRFDTSMLQLRAVPVATLGDRLPAGGLRDRVVGLVGDRYRHLDRHLADADVVHAEELSYWFAADAARVRDRPASRFRLLQTVWETIPLLETYRTPTARRRRQAVLAASDLFLAATERAAASLRLEGVEEERIQVCSPGIDLERFRVAAAPDPPPEEHLVLSAGRLVWEKGHQDVLRAVAALRDGIAGDRIPPARVLIVGSGPEEGRLRAYARELGLADRVELRPAAYQEMPGIYARASCLVLASLPASGGAYHPLDQPRVFWEEQFGMVLVEAMAAGLDLLVSTSGAIPEVAGDGASYFAPGDWLGLAHALADGPLARPILGRVEHPREVVERYSSRRAAERLAAAYERLLAERS